MTDDGFDYDWDASVGAVLDEGDDHVPDRCALDVSICPVCGPLVDRGDPELEAELDDLRAREAAEWAENEPEVGF